MQILITLLFSGVAAFQLSTATSRVTRSQPVLVQSIVDGNTIHVSTYGRVRLLGIIAPKIGRGLNTAAPFGQEAQERLRSLLANRWVYLEQEGPALDAYNRHLAYVLTGDGQCVNTVMVREGFARVSARTALTRLAELQRAESDAQTTRRGMWGNSPQIPSASYTSRSGARRSTAARSKKPSKRTKKP
jgi:micrococcal nuclease